MHIDIGIIFGLLGAVISVGGICVSFGILKGKIEHAVEENKLQSDQFKECATKAELSAAVQRADDLRNRNTERIALCAPKSEMDMLIRRLDEDRKDNSEQYRKLSEATNAHSKQISALEVTLAHLKDSFEKWQSEIRSGIETIQKEVKELRHVKESRRGA